MYGSGSTYGILIDLFTFPDGDVFVCFLFSDRNACISTELIQANESGVHVNPQTSQFLLATV